MTGKDIPRGRGPTTRLHELMEEARALRRREVAVPGLSAARRVLAEWQSQRLARTYADFARQSRYRPAVDFFLGDLYGPTDFAQRDADIQRVYPMMSRVLGGPALEAITRAIELRVLSDGFDARMADLLVSRFGLADRLDAETYAEAFRLCDDRPGRLRQIELVEEVGRALDAVARNPVIHATVLAARLPAKLAGFGELQDFVERGLRAFRHMRGAGELIAAIGERERRMLDLILAGASTEEWDAASRE
jgi:hypothetical protein